MSENKNTPTPISKAPSFDMKQHYDSAQELVNPITEQAIEGPRTLENNVPNYAARRVGVAVAGLVLGVGALQGLDAAKAELYQPAKQFAENTGLIEPGADK